jgi:hypothetical protein
MLNKLKKILKRKKEVFVVTIPAGTTKAEAIALAKGFKEIEEDANARFIVINSDIKVSCINKEMREWKKTE